MFRFKQFTVDQSGCAMKINTDGVLLGAIAAAEAPGHILDIGTGTGVIALMLAQRFADAKIDAVEIDEVAAYTAEENFKGSPFADRLEVFPISFQSYFNRFPDRKYDLIVTNPPFYINALKSAGAKRSLAKHAGADFFEALVIGLSNHLTQNGRCWLIVPADISERIVALAAGSNLFPRKVINVHSYAGSPAHRTILCFGFDKSSHEISKLTIYQAPDIYTGEYNKLLRPFFLAL